MNNQSFLPLNIYVMFLGVILLIPITIYAQPKFEQESRIREEEVPQSALSFVDSCLFDRKIKWYREISNNGTSVEAKTRFGRRKYSIEFDTLGVIQDVEIKVDFNEVPTALRAIIRTQLKDTFSKYRIAKTQLQLVGDRKKLLDLVLTQPSPQSTSGLYEIVVHGKIDRKHVAYEFLFSMTGQIIRKSEIITQQTDHLDY